jgi:2-polyprenyl-6-hydroxyphenyl methylase/3-demethylubiquinone-9 3-methyltransferase
MAQRGAQVTGIDLAKKSLKVAQLHSLESGVAVEYRCIAVEDLADEAQAVLMW